MTDEEIIEAMAIGMWQQRSETFKELGACPLPAWSSEDERCRAAVRLEAKAALAAFYKLPVYKDMGLENAHL